MTVAWRSPALDGTLTYSNNNLTVLSGGAGYSGSEATEGKTSGKWYWEITIDTIYQYGGIGIHKTGNAINMNYVFGHDSLEYGYVPAGQKMNTYAASAYGSSYTTGNTIGIALDMDNKALYFFKNGIAQGKAFDLPSDTSFSPAFNIWGGGKITANFGATTFKYPDLFKSLGGYKSYDGSQLPPLYLIKQFDKYYSIKPEYYNLGNNYIPLTLAGGAIPNTQDIETFGFYDPNDLLKLTTIGSETFKPIDKLNNRFQVAFYRK